MYIKELYIGAFGGLKERSFSFSRGVNLIEGGNESGKSTLCAFIKFIFFGLPAKSRVVMSDRKRYLPFDGSPASGTLTLLTDEGEYIISRTFTPSGRGGSDKTEIKSLTTGEAINADPAELFLGMTEGLFTRTAYIPQLSGGRIDGNEVSTAMENLLYSKDEEIDSAAAIKALEKAATALVHKRGAGGRLGEATAELDLLTAKAAVSGNAGKELARLDEQISTLSRSEKENEKILREAEENLARYRNARILSTFDELDAAQKELSEQKAQFDSLLPGGNIPASEDLMEMVRLSEAIKNTERELTDREAAPLPELPVSRLAADGGKDKVKSELSALASKSKTLITAGVMLTLAAAAMAVLAFIIPAKAPVFTGAGLAAAVGILLLCAGISVRRKKKAKLSDYGVDSVAELEGLAHREESERMFFEREMAHRRMELTELQSKKQEQIARASLLLQRYGTEYSSADRLADKVAHLSALREKLTAMKSSMEQSAREQKRVEQSLSDYDREELKRTLGADHYEILSDIDVKENERRATFGATSRETLREKLSALQVQRVSLSREADEAAAVGERIAALTDEISALRGRYNAITMALSALESAAADVKEQFSPALAKRAAEIMAQATGGKYDRFLLGREMNISYMDNAYGGAVRDADHLSAGTKDMAYLSLRLALCEVLCEKGNLPMIFDESFAAMDDARLSAILSVIAEREGQSFILTSGVREGAALTECNKIKM